MVDRTLPSQRSARTARSQGAKLGNTQLTPFARSIKKTNGGVDYGRPAGQFKSDNEIKMIDRGRAGWRPNGWAAYHDDALKT